MVTQGFEVVSAADALVAFLIAKVYDPELIVAAPCLPRIDGLQLIRNLDASATRHVPILVLTAATDPAMLEQALAAGPVTILPALMNFGVLHEHVIAA